MRWVITVPAIWRQQAKQFMREAAYEVRRQLAFNPYIKCSGSGSYLNIWTWIRLVFHFQSFIPYIQSILPFIRTVYSSDSFCYTANEGPVRIQNKCLVPIYAFPEIKLLFPKQNYNVLSPCSYTHISVRD